MKEKYLHRLGIAFAIMTLSLLAHNCNGQNIKFKYNRVIYEGKEYLESGEIGVVNNCLVHNSRLFKPKAYFVHRFDHSVGVKFLVKDREITYLYNSNSGRFTMFKPWVAKTYYWYDKN